MLSFFLLIMGFLGNMNEGLIIDFASEKSGMDWMIVNDGVMGGRSEGMAYLKENSLFYSGQISFENNGGFSSIRSRYDRYDLSAFSEVEIKYRNKHQGFAIVLEKDRRWYQPGYRKAIKTISEDWNTVTIPLSDFDETRVGEYSGRKLQKEDLDKIIRLGIIIYNKIEGPFELEIDYIKFN